MNAARNLTETARAEIGNVVPLDRERIDAGRAGETQTQPPSSDVGMVETSEAPEPQAIVAEQAPDVARKPAETAPAATQPSDAKPANAKKRSRSRLLLPVGILVLLGGGGWYGYEWWTNGRFIVSTDDAYVQADVATLGTKVAGYVAAVAVKDGDPVKAGDVVLTLDDTDYKLALDAARAKRATQGATIDRIEQQIEAQRAQIDSADAGLASAAAEQTRAAAAYERAEALAQQSFQSKAVLDQAIADRDRAIAGVNSAKATLAASKANLTVIAAQKAEAIEEAKELDTAVAKAQSDLDATRIRAPSDGIVGNRAAQPGQYVSPGSRLMALVPMHSVYIAANFKETQLGSIRPGQSAHVSVDSMDGESFSARVESLSPASGSMFSLLPPENATGNFTKITQRVPVRVEIPADMAATNLLRPGLSVVVSIDTRTKDVGTGNANASTANASAKN